MNFRRYLWIVLACCLVVIPVYASELDNKINDLSKQITSHMTKNKTTNNRLIIAVTEFPTIDGNNTLLGKAISEQLTTKLYLTKKFDIIERGLLNKALAELQLTTTNIDSDNAKKLGKVLGFSAIVTGTITELDKTIQLNARLIATETGLVFGVAAVKIKKDDDVKELLSQLTEELKNNDDASSSSNETYSTTVPTSGLANSDQIFEPVSTIVGKEHGLTGKYYSVGTYGDGKSDYTTDINQNCQYKFSRIDPKIDFNDPANRAFFWPFGFDHAFAVEWSGYIYIWIKGYYSFMSESDDDSFVYLDNKLIINSNPNKTDISKKILLRTGFYEIKIQYFKNGETIPTADGNAAYIQLKWDSPYDRIDGMTVVPENVFYTTDQLESSTHNQTNPAIYLPLQTGNSWNYEGIGFNGEKLTAQFTVSKSTSIDNLITAELDMLKDGEQTKINFLTTPYEISVQMQTTAKMILRPETNIAILRYPIQVGPTYENTGVVLDHNYKFITNFSMPTTILGFETVTVPAGTFKALKIKTVLEIGNSISDSCNYLAEGIGIIKIETKNSNKGQEGYTTQTMELVSYQLSPSVTGMNP